MEVNNVSPSLSLSHNQQQENVAAKKDDVKGIMPKDELREHLAFQLNNFFQNKEIYPLQEVYILDCRTGARNIYDNVVSRQITNGVGGG